MSDNVIIAIVASLPSVIAAVGTIINIVLHHKTDGKITILEKTTNGMQDALLSKTAKLEYLRGKTGEAPSSKFRDRQTDPGLDK